MLVLVEEFFSVVMNWIDCSIWDDSSNWIRCSYVDWMNSSTHSVSPYLMISQPANRPPNRTLNQNCPISEVVSAHSSSTNLADWCRGCCCCCSWMWLFVVSAHYSHLGSCSHNCYNCYHRYCCWYLCHLEQRNWCIYAWVMVYLWSRMC